MSEMVVEVIGVSKTYKRGPEVLHVLTDLDLEVTEGDFVGLMGPSGSGKTTLLNLIATVDQATSGRILVAGQDTGGLSDNQLAAWRHRHIGFIFQLYNLIPVLTAYENVELPLTLSRLSSKEMRRKVETALAVVGLEDRMDRAAARGGGGKARGTRQPGR